MHWGHCKSKDFIIYKQLEEFVEEHGMIVSYDGMKVLLFKKF